MAASLSFKGSENKRSILGIKDTDSYKSNVAQLRGVDPVIQESISIENNECRTVIWSLLFALDCTTKINMKKDPESRECVIDQFSNCLNDLSNVHNGSKEFINYQVLTK